MTTVSARDTFIDRLSVRDPARTEADVQADIYGLLTVGDLNVSPDTARMESPSADGTRRRIDVEIGQLAIEVKKDLRVQTVRVDGTDQLQGYVQTRSVQSGARYSGVLTDGVLWLLFNLGVDGIEQVAELDMTSKPPLTLVRWLEAVLSTQTQVLPSPDEIVRRLGAGSPAHLVDIAAFTDLYRANAQKSEVLLKRQLWAKLLRTAFGAAFDDDETLFINHTLLVLTAELIAHAALGFDVGATGGYTPRQLSLGTEFANAQIYGVVQADFFDWLLDVEGGDELVASLARRVAQFDWSATEHDVLKLLYESVIGADDRRSLGEYYTPDWLAQAVVDEAVTNPLSQRVADVAAGSGTFLYHAIRKYLAAAEEASIPNGEALRGVTEHVIGMDVHPVAVTIARVTYLLAIGAERLTLSDRGALVIPVYLGDSLQWEQHQDVFTSLNELAVSTSGSDLVEAGGALFHDDLIFPRSALADASNFDRLVNAMAERASDTSSKSDAAVIMPTLHQFGVPEADIEVLVTTYATMRRLHADGRDTIWGYYVRNLVRPTWLAEETNKVDVLVGNPPWLRYSSMTGTMQNRFTSMLRQRGLITGRAGASGRDLSALFVVRAAELYLHDGGHFSFVMPHGILTRQPHAAFRSGQWHGPSFDLRVSFHTSWDLHRAATGFPNHAAVIHGSVAAKAKAMSAEVEAWVTRGGASNVSWQAMAPRLTRSPSTIGVTEEGGTAEFSPYKRRFRAGAVLFPRMLVIVERRDASPLGVGKNRIPVISRKRSQDKGNWKPLPPLTGVIETAFVKPVHLGETCLPFRMTEPKLGVVPATSEMTRLLRVDEIAAHPDLAKWWDEAEAIWDANKSRNDRDTLLEHIDYMRQLSAQLPQATHRVVYTASGNTLAAARVPEANSVIEHKLYWAAVNSVEEGRYLVGILNSTSVLEQVRPYQAIGLFGPRDFDKNVFRALIPPFDVDDANHRALAEHVGEMEAAAAQVDVSGAGTFQAARKLIRSALVAQGQAQILERLVLAAVPAK
jgi:hypothetical protein